MYKGIDVSQYQGDIDWNKVAAAGIQFAIIRCCKKDLSVDPYFQRNYDGAIANGLAVGAYKYSYATTVEEAEAEAKATLEALNGKHLGAKVWLDLEDKCQHDLDKELLYQIVKRWLEIVEAAGYEVGIYCNQYWFKSVLTDKIKALTKNFWIAKWSENKPELGIEVIAWQFSSEGFVSGIRGDVDMDYYYGEFDNVKAEEPEAVIPETPANPEVKFSVGDTVKVKRAIQYDNGKPFKLYCETYKVMQVGSSGKPKRIVIGNNGEVEAAVNADDLIKVMEANPTPEQCEIKVGDTVKVKRAIQYDNGKPFKLYCETYKVIQVGSGVKPNRIVIGNNGKVVAAVHRDNLQKV